MKKGKSVKLNLYSSIKSCYGTVDSKEFKSVFINLQSWVEPIKEVENWNRVVNNLKRDIKISTTDVINEDIFRKECIVDLDLRTSGICTGKKSFLNLEVTCFVNEGVNFKSREVKEQVKKIVRSIYTENFLNNKTFEFYISKRDNVII